MFSQSENIIQKNEKQEEIHTRHLVYSIRISGLWYRIIE